MAWYNFFIFDMEYLGVSANTDIILKPSFFPFWAQVSNWIGL